MGMLKGCGQSGLGVLFAICAAACGGGNQEARGVMMNHFIPDEKLSAVHVCKTKGAELVKSFGDPAQRGMDGDMTTLNWGAAAIAQSGDQTMMGTQTIIAWVDADGLVAGFVVNPMTLSPTKPAPCREQQSTVGGTM